LLFYSCNRKRTQFSDGKKIRNKGHKKERKKEKEKKEKRKEDGEMEGRRPTYAFPSRPYWA
jgi:hypothetical protein